MQAKKCIRVKRYQEGIGLRIDRKLIWLTLSKRKVKNMCK